MIVCKRDAQPEVATVTSETVAVAAMTTASPSWRMRLFAFSAEVSQGEIGEKRRIVGPRRTRLPFAGLRLKPASPAQTREFFEVYGQARMKRRPSLSPL